MNIIYRSLCAALLVLIFAISFCGCAKKYRDDIRCEQLAREMYDEVDSFGELSSYSEDDVQLLFGNTSLFDDFSVIYSTDANDINEIGVFHSPDERSAKELLTVVKGYINRMKETKSAFIASYAPREIPKLEGAEAKKYGNYVIYAILGEADLADALDEAKDTLEK